MPFELQKDVKVEFDPKGMPFRRLGPSGLRVPLFSLGGWLTLGGSVHGDAVKDIMKTAFDNGINLIDTAEAYANGQSELEIGRVIKELGWRRTDIIITTKIFWGVGRKEPNAGGLSRKHIIEGVQESLARLQLDYVDIVFAHRSDPNVPMEEVVRAFNFVIEKGWAMYWATSEWTAVEIEEAHHVATKLGLIAPVADQCQHNMFCRERPEKEFAPLYQKYNYGTTTFSSLYFGLLSGKYNDGIPPDSRFATESDFKNRAKELQEEKGKEMIRKVKELTIIAEKELNTTISALALAWVARHPNTSTVILGASKPEQVLENLKAIEVVPKLTDELMDRIDSILANKPSPPSTYGRPLLDPLGQHGPKVKGV
ncbi:NADP-dependent oxidoreductase domain-containing protein [Rhodocollybia butyracea]|uniref:NADP-dependent oxidoreductase domain-containing protein n=1 Tax=Rhodocollybia butyracea TaxID=206335 RepID=A0A9P5Q3K3_9AGAR|nr:NADP-dependent oxidoreductase domain-containing protein [Rhodocollybia butyracea]